MEQHRSVTWIVWGVGDGRRGNERSVLEDTARRLDGNGHVHAIGDRGAL